jgi:hypothetical protein
VAVVIHRLRGCGMYNMVLLLAAITRIVKCVIHTQDVNTLQGCEPYPFPPHSSNQYNTPPCVETCQGGYDVDSYFQDKRRGDALHKIEYIIIHF